MSTNLREFLTQAMGEEENFEAWFDAKRICFRLPKDQVFVVWEIDDRELSRLATKLSTSSARGDISGEGLLAIHLHEALATFTGVRGQVEVTQSGLTILED